MNLYLVQHAKAKQKEEDPERPLTENGISSISRVAFFAAQYTDITVTRIIHSGKKRALQTAEILAKELKPEKGIDRGLELNPISQPWSWVESLAQIEEDVMLVGHLPHLKRLTALLLCQDESKQIVEFKNGGIISLVRNESGMWTMRWMVIPQIIPDVK